MRKVLLIGGSGFIGSHLLKAFEDRKDVQLRVAVRPSSRLPVPKKSSTGILRGDFFDPVFLSDICQGMDLVIHNAGYARDWGKRSTFWQVNADLPNLVLRSCLEAGIKKVILTGTNSVYGEEHNLVEKDEDSPFSPHHNYFLSKIFPSGLNYYRESKTEGVLRAQKYAAENNLNLMIMEPVWVFGPGEFHTGFYDYIKSVEDGFPFAPGSRRNEFSLIYVNDLVRAYLLAMDSTISGVHRFLLASPEKVKMADFYSKLCKAGGLRAPKLLPKWLMGPIGFVMETLWSIFKAKKPPLLTRGRVAMFYDHISFSSEKARKVLGFSANTPLDQAIEETITWYRNKGYLRSKP